MLTDYNTKFSFILRFCLHTPVWTQLFPYNLITKCVYVCVCIYIYIYIYIYILWRYGPTLARASSFTRFLDLTQRRSTVGRTPLDEWSARCRDLYLTTHNTHNIHAPGGIRTHNLSRRAAADLRLRPRGHWDRHIYIYIYIYIYTHTCTHTHTHIYIYIYIYI